MYYKEVFNLSDFLHQFDLINGKFFSYQYDKDILVLVGTGAYSGTVIKTSEKIYYEYLESRFNTAEEALSWKHSLPYGANSPLKLWGTRITDSDIESLFAVPNIIPDFGIFDSKLIIFAIIAIIIFFIIMVIL